MLFQHLLSNGFILHGFCILPNQVVIDFLRPLIHLLPNACAKMKSVFNKKFILQLLSIELIRLMFIGVIILTVTFAYNRNSQKTIDSPSSKGKFLAHKTNHCSSSILSKGKFLAHETNHRSSSILSKGEFLAHETNHRSSSIGRKKAERLLHPIVIQTASRHRVDPALVKAIIMAESGYNIRAISRCGAKGLMQLMPATARALGVEDAFNPKQNISGGVRYFKQLVTQFDGDIELALAAYNAGSRNVRHYQGIPPFKATRHYIKKVFKYYKIYKAQMANTENDSEFSNNANHYS
jgi:hypothetical protein